MNTRSYPNLETAGTVPTAWFVIEIESAEITGVWNFNRSHYGALVRSALRLCWFDL